MKVKVMYHGLYREITGVKEEIVTLKEGSSIKVLLDVLENKYGSDLTGQLIDFETGKIWSLMALAINGTIINSDKLYSKLLMNNDEIILLPPALGG
ncbi:hypothetical protein JCM17380_33770 [Desulfosporosinus burensis]